MDAGIPRFNLGFAKNLRSYCNIVANARKLGMLLKDFTFHADFRRAETGRPARPHAAARRGRALGVAVSFRKLARHILIYGSGVWAGKAIGFIMIPVYTRALNTADYGVLELASRTTDIAALVLGWV